MFSRRMFVALAVCFAVSAAPAFAGGGGGGGAKKNSTIKVKNNNSGKLVYAFVDVDFTVVPAPTTDAQARALGGKPIQNGGFALFPVTTGKHSVTVSDIAQTVGFVGLEVETLKGKTTLVNTVP